MASAILWTTKGLSIATKSFRFIRETINPMKKKRITEPLDLGVRSINGLLTCGKGQRMGILQVQAWGRACFSA